MRRRDLIVVFAGAVAAGPLTSRLVGAQSVSPVPHVGVLHEGSRGRTSAGDEFREGMRALGWIDGTTILIEDRFADGDAVLLSANAAALVAEKVAVIVAIAPRPTQAAHEATSTIPIVTSAADPNYGIVASLARPGGNVTGLSVMWPDLVAKQVQLLKEAAPRVSKISILMQPGHKPHEQLMTELERAAPNLGVSMLPVFLGTVAGLTSRFDAMTAAGADGYFVLSEPRTTEMRDDIAALALHHRLPGAAQERRQVEAGALLCYGVNFAPLFLS